MSAPYADLTHWVPIAVLLASLAGSAHCISMCGGLAIATAKSRKRAVLYHFGRLLGYLGLGALAGGLGSQVLSESIEFQWLSLSSAFLLGIGFVLGGVQVWRGKTPHLPWIPQRLFHRIYRRTQGNALTTGLLSSFLPCGWLHSFVLGAVTTRSVGLGAGFLLMFWLGTLPALSATPWMTHRLFRPVALRAPKVAALMLILAGAFSLSAKVWPQIYPHARAEHCSHFSHPKSSSSP